MIMVKATTKSKSQNNGGIIVGRLPFLGQRDQGGYYDQDNTGCNKEVEKDESKDFDGLVEFNDRVFDFFVLGL